MAEKEAKKPEKAEAPAKAGGDEKKADGKSGGGIGGLLAKTPVLLGAVMLVEAVVLFAGFKFLMGGPKQAAAVEVTTGESGKVDESAGGAAGGGHGDAGHGGEAKAGGAEKKLDKKAQVELPVVEFRAPNKQSGRTFIYDVAIFVLTKLENKDKVKDTIAARDALIKDRVRTIIAQSDPEKLEGGSEPNLDTLRRQVKVQLDDVIGEGLIDEVLVPRCIPFRTDY
jgi:flagellar basal body-associated protein FliL